MRYKIRVVASSFIYDVDAESDEEAKDAAIQEFKEDFWDNHSIEAIIEEKHE